VPRAETSRRRVELGGEDFLKDERERARRYRARRKADPELEATFKQQDRERARTYRERKRAERAPLADGPGLTTLELAERIGAHPADVRRIMREELERGRVHLSRGGRGRR
jgi:ribosome-binding protein aMBF1 (putative translation factor)